MKIYTRVVYDIETLQLIEADFYEYSGATALCKGDSTDKSTEESQAQFDTTLQGIFESQYANQSSQLTYLKNQLQPQVNEGGQGYTPAQLTAQQTAATDNDAVAYQQAQQALNNQEGSNGSKLAGVAGANVEASAGLASAEAAKLSTDQNQIVTNNATLQNQNYWNAINGLNGVAAQTDPLGYSSAATGAGSSVAGLSTAFTNSNQSQILGALGGIAGGAGTALAGFAKSGGA